MVKGKGTKESPWELKTPPGSSDYIMYKDDSVDPAILVCKLVVLHCITSGGQLMTCMRC